MIHQDDTVTAGLIAASARLTWVRGRGGSRDHYSSHQFPTPRIWKPFTSIRHPTRTVTVGVQVITIQPALSTFPFQFPFHQVNVKASPPPAPAPPTSTLKCLFIQDDVDIVPDTRPPSPNICTHKTHNSVFPGLIMS